MTREEQFDPIARQIMGVLPEGYDAVVILVAPRAANGDSATATFSTLPPPHTVSLLKHLLVRQLTGAADAPVDIGRKLS